MTSHDVITWRIKTRVDLVYRYLIGSARIRACDERRASHVIFLLNKPRVPYKALYDLYITSFDNKMQFHITLKPWRNCYCIACSICCYCFWIWLVRMRSRLFMLKSERRTNASKKWDSEKVRKRPSTMRAHFWTETGLKIPLLCWILNITPPYCVAPPPSAKHIHFWPIKTATGHAGSRPTKIATRWL